MGTMFWVTSAALYYKINPISGARRIDQSFSEEFTNIIPNMSDDYALVPQGFICI